MNPREQQQIALALNVLNLWQAREADGRLSEAEKAVYTAAVDIVARVFNPSTIVPARMN